MATDNSEQRWPDELTIVRHGESAGNVARDLALAAGLKTIDIEPRDCDVLLSNLGERQSSALGHWLGKHGQIPHAVLTSPYVRAQQTAEIILSAAGWDSVPLIRDERLREREFGILDRLTSAGIEHRYPDQKLMRMRLGKFYYRPPGGESWTDVILRLRSVMDTISRDYRNKRVLIISHQVVVLCFRYLIEKMDEKEILAIDRAGDVANCSITNYRIDGHDRSSELRLDKYNFVTPLREAGEKVTRSPDAPVAPK